MPQVQGAQARPIYCYSMGVYVTNEKTFAFRHVKPPTVQEIAQLIENISQRVGRYLERQGLVLARFRAHKSKFHTTVLLD